VHFPSDVVGGAIVGICSATLVWHAALWRRLAVMPNLLPYNARTHSGRP
jgi:undecaprenyl-diphosphatase